MPVFWAIVIAINVTRERAIDKDIVIAIEIVLGSTTTLDAAKATAIIDKAIDIGTTIATAKDGKKCFTNNFKIS